MKEKDSLLNTSKIKISNESLKALSFYLKLRIQRDREIKEKFFSEKKK